MKRKTWKWRNKLSHTDLRHLKETGTITLAQVKKNVAHQDTMEYPCWECVSIGRKLDLNVTLTAFHNKHFQNG